MLKCWTKKRNNGTTYKTCTRNAKAIVPRKTKMPAKKQKLVIKGSASHYRLLSKRGVKSRNAKRRLMGY